MSVHPGRFGQPGRRRVESENGGNGSRYDDLERRLRAVEEDIREITTRIENIATKQDIELAIERLKKWAIAGCAVGAAAVIGWLVFLIIRLMSPS